MSLNSIPLPVQAMKWELVGLSNRATRNCQSWSDPRLWYGGPSRYPPASCLMSPAEKNKQDISEDNSAKTTGEKRKKKNPALFTLFIISLMFTWSVSVHIKQWPIHKQLFQELLWAASQLSYLCYKAWLLLRKLKKWNTKKLCMNTPARTQCNELCRHQSSGWLRWWITLSYTKTPSPSFSNLQIFLEQHRHHQ